MRSSRTKERVSCRIPTQSPVRCLPKLLSSLLMYISEKYINCIYHGILHGMYHCIYHGIYSDIYHALNHDIYSYIYFYYMYINKHESNLGKHLTDWVIILLLTLSFVLLDVIEPEVCLYIRNIQIMYYIPCYIPCYILSYTSDYIPWYITWYISWYRS